MYGQEQFATAQRMRAWARLSSFVVEEMEARGFWSRRTSRWRSELGTGVVLGRNFVV